MSPGLRYTSDSLRFSDCTCFLFTLNVILTRLAWTFCFGETPAGWNSEAELCVSREIEDWAEPHAGASLCFISLSDLPALHLSYKVFAICDDSARLYMLCKSGQLNSDISVWQIARLTAQRLGEAHCQIYNTRWAQREHTPCSNDSLVTNHLWGNWDQRE